MCALFLVPALPWASTHLYVVMKEQTNIFQNSLQNQTPFCIRVTTWFHLGDTTQVLLLLKQDGYQYNDVRGTMSSLKGGSRRELGPGQVEDERYSRVRHAPLPVYHDSIAHVLGRKSNVCFIDPRTRQEHQLYKRLNIKRGELARWYYPRTEIDRRKTLSSDSGATLEKGGTNDVKVAVSVSSKKTELLKKSVMCKYLIKHECVLCLRFYSQMFHLVHIRFFLVLWSYICMHVLGNIFF